MEQPQYPEHEKLQAVKDKSQAIGEFLEWLSSVKKLHFAKWIKETAEEGFPNPEETEIDVFVQQPMEIEKWLSEYFNIDLNKLEQEKRAMLEHIRALNQKG